MRVIEVNIPHHLVPLVVHLNDQLPVQIVQEIFGVGFVNLRVLIAPKAVEVDAGNFPLGSNTGDDLLDATGQEIGPHALVIAAFGPPTAVDLDHIRLGGDFFQHIHVSVDILGGENSTVIIPGGPAFKIGRLQFLDAVLRCNGGTELVESHQPIVPAFEHNLLIRNCFTGFELPALAVGPDHDRVVLDREVWQEDAPRERPSEEILAVRQSHHFKHVAGAFRSRRSDVLAQDGCTSHATAAVKSLEITGQFFGHGDADVDPLDRQRFRSFVG